MGGLVCRICVKAAQSLSDGVCSECVVNCMCERCISNHRPGGYSGPHIVNLVWCAGTIVLLYADGSLARVNELTTSGVEIVPLKVVVKEPSRLVGG